MTFKKTITIILQKESNRNNAHRIKSEQHKVAGGSYTILDNDLLNFHKEYYKHVIKKEQPEYLTEYQQKDCGPICIDFDFRYDLNNIDTRQHT